MMLHCKNLILGYDKALTRPINLELPINAWIGVVGQNGSGKSTFLKTILGEQALFAGELKVFGSNPGKLNRVCAYIPQEREINLALQMSAYSLIKSSIMAWKFGIPWLNSKTLSRIDYLIELVGANSYVNKAFNQLSGGQKKRIYLAQALVNQPKLLLLDEPLSDLDPLAKAQFLLALKQIHHAEKISLLMISHDMQEVHAYLDGFIHFSKTGVHHCKQLACIREDSYVDI